jgi:glycosyltransferase involved in cell wall biosynthesis
LSDLNEVIPRLNGYTVELIVVDDHSVDGTAEIARSLGACVIRNEGRHSGKGVALRVGFAAARGDCLVMMDADYSHRPEDLPLLIEALDKGAGLVVGSRIYGGTEEYTRVRAFGNIILTFWFGFFSGRYLSDALNGYKAFRRDVFTDFDYTSRDFEIEIELLANALRKGYRIVEVPSHERGRHAGVAKSKVIKHGTKFALRVVREWLKDGVKKVS